MLTESELQALLDYHSVNPVISIYLNTDPAEGNTETHKLRLRSLLKNLEQVKDSERIERFFDHEFDWAGRSVAIFSCSPDDFFRSIPLMVPLHSRIRVGNHPHIKPLADLLDLYGGYGVAIVDKQSVRCLAFHVGELVDEKEYHGESVRKIKHGGGSQSSGARGKEVRQLSNAEEIAERNMKEAGDFAASFFKEHDIRRVLIGGSEDNIALFKPHLPKTWQSLIIGTFPIRRNANPEEILEKILEIGKKAEQAQEKELIDSLITNTAKGQGGVLALDETLGAVYEGRVQTLLLDRDFRAAGYRCTECGFMTTQHLNTCPFCGNPFDPITDAVEFAVRKVLQSGGDVEILQGEVTLKDHGHIGALLRY